MKNIQPAVIRVSFLVFLVGACLCSRAQDSCSIPVGKSGRIVIDLRRGTYDLQWKGFTYVKDAYALVRDGQGIDTRTAGQARVSKENSKTPLGKATRYTVTYTNAPGFSQQFFVYKDQGYFTTQLVLETDKPVGWMGVLLTDQLQLSNTGDNRALYVPFDNDMWARFNAAPMADARFSSSEVSAFYNTASNNGLVMGSLEQDRWKSGVTVKGKTGSSLEVLSLYAGFSDSTVTHDVIPHGRIKPINGVVSSPMFFAGNFADWRDGMETFAASASKYQPRVIFSWDKPTPVGWNSWGVIKDKLKWEQVQGVVDFFADSLPAFRTKDKSLFIDLDAFWDNMTPGGIGGDVTKLKDFVTLCRSKGFRPGIYWTPFADWGKSDKKVEGSSYTYGQTWTKQNGRMLDIDGGRAMDPTHPATRQRIVYVISKMKELGFEMIKIDFLGHGAIEADRFHDPAVSSGMQAYTSGMAFLDSVLGKQMLVYAAISPTMATARFVHMRRIACDAWSSIDNTEYTLNSTGYGWWQSGIYNYMDADHVVLGTEKEGVNRARVASAIVTGSLITGDDYSAAGPWQASAKKLLQDPALIRITDDGKSFRPVLANTGDRGVEIFYKKSGKDSYLAVFNYSGELKKVMIPETVFPAYGRTDLTELFTGDVQVFNPTEGVSIPAQDVRFYRFSTSRK
ncbi:MAG: alpha-galactosidase [Chitinophagaceae bacterium]|nr:MAG: alpha-galactosidase [Chitinophagaceae bacterium]